MSDFEDVLEEVLREDGRAHCPEGMVARIVAGLPSRRRPRPKVGGVLSSAAAVIVLGVAAWMALQTHTKASVEYLNEQASNPDSLNSARPIPVAGETAADWPEKGNAYSALRHRYASIHVQPIQLEPVVLEPIEIGRLNEHGLHEGKEYR